MNQQLLEPLDFPESKNGLSGFRNLVPAQRQVTNSNTQEQRASKQQIPVTDVRSFSLKQCVSTEDVLEGANLAKLAKLAQSASVQTDLVCKSRRNCNHSARRLNVHTGTLLFTSSMQILFLEQRHIVLQDQMGIKTYISRENMQLCFFSH